MIIVLRDRLNKLSEEELERLIEKLKLEIKKVELSNLKKKMIIEEIS